LKRTAGSAGRGRAEGRAVKQGVLVVIEGEEEEEICTVNRKVVGTCWRVLARNGPRHPLLPLARRRNR